MDVYRKRFQKGRRFYTNFKVDLEPAELDTLKSAGLMEYKIQQRPGSIMGKTIVSVGVVNALQAQINRVKNRWSVALVRTSGFVFIDIILIYLRFIKSIFGFIWRIFFGTRRKFSGMIYGMNFSARRIEDLKEIEVFVLISIAAVHQALEYAQNIERDDVFHGHEYRKEIEGLTFGGAVVTEMASGDQSVDLAVEEINNLISDDITDVSDTIADWAGGS